MQQLYSENIDITIFIYFDSLVIHCFSVLRKILKYVFLWL